VDNFWTNLVNFLKSEFARLNYKMDRLTQVGDTGSQKIFHALVELDSKFASGNQMGYNADRKFRPAEYHEYQDELVQALEDINEKTKVDIAKSDELAVSLVFFQTNLKQNNRSTKDLDNMEKPTLDAMQMALGFDDAQIIDKRSRKMMGFQRALQITIWKV
jgi:Holliday junction resolvase RusA-like endonuclease